MVAFLGPALAGASALGGGGAAPTTVIPKLGGDAGPSSSDANVNLGTNINVAPTAVNFGELLKNFSGPPENGGFGLNSPSRLFPINAKTRGFASAGPGLDLMTIGLAAGALVVGVILFRMVR